MSTMIKDFVAIIMSNGRPENVYTYNTLKKQGYTGDIIVLIDDEDTELDNYKGKFKEELQIFNKNDIEKRLDTYDNFENKKCIVYSRNACFDVAEKLGYKYFIELDDDYTRFQFMFDKDFNFTNKRKKINNLNNIFAYMLDFFKNTNLVSLAMAQGGDFIGGKECNVWSSKFSRKSMNSMIHSTERKITYNGRINEDVNTYTKLGGIGFLFHTIKYIALIQKPTQKQKGGMTDIYLDSGTYVKSFYTIIANPSCSFVTCMGKKKRLHHNIKWNNAVPQIIDEKYKQ